MADKLLILGDSGSGKTYSMRNLDPKETFYICPDEKELSFKGGEKKYVEARDSEGKIDLANTNRYETTNFDGVIKMLKAISEKKELAHIKYIVLDTITNMMVSDFMNRAKEKNFDKFTDFATNLYNIVQTLRRLRSDLTVIIFAHNDVQDRQGQMYSDLFIPGGKLSRKSKPESKFTTVLETYVEHPENGEFPKYHFRTQNMGDGIAKSPAGMFDSYLISNDLTEVIQKMEEFNQSE